MAGALMSKFTTDEESMILTCIANGVPLCCARHDDTLRAIIKPKRRREQFEVFAHGSLGCSFDFAKHPSIWDTYLENTITWLDSFGQRRKARKR